MGHILLLIAVLLYIAGKKVYSITLFFAFILSGFRILPDIFWGAKLTYMAFGYIVVISLYNAYYIPGYFMKKPLAKPIWLFLMFIFISCLYSCIHYDFPTTDVVITSLRYTMVLSYFFLVRLSENELNRLLRIFLNITVITATLYALQTVTGIQLLTYSYGIADTPDSEVGLFRFYNRPPLLELSLLASFFYTSIFNKKYIILCQIIFITAIVVSMTRGSMIAIALSIFIGFLLSGDWRKNYKKVLFFCVTSMLLFPLISSRFMSGETINDIQILQDGDTRSVDGRGNGNKLSLSWRIGWIAERWEYLQDRPVSESLFGLGLLPNEHSIMQQKYNFKFGLWNKETGVWDQIRAADTAWGNLLATIGILGSYFWLYLCFIIAKFLYRKKSEQLALLFGLLLIYYLLFSIAHSELSEPYIIPILFLPIGVLINRSNKDSQTKMNL
jgi:hypothetical protein